MNATIYLFVDKLFREPFRKNLSEAGFTINGLSIESGAGISQNTSSQVYLVQARRWGDFSNNYNHDFPVVMFGVPTLFYYWFNAASDNISAYITPKDAPEVMISSLTEVIGGNHYLSSVMRNYLDLPRKTMQEKFLGEKLTSHLTPSELEVMVLAGEQYTTSEIAAKRFRSVHTIKTQRKKIRSKIKTIQGERLAVFTGKKLHELRTLLSIEKNSGMLKKISKNTP